MVCHEERMARILHIIKEIAAGSLEYNRVEIIRDYIALKKEICEAASNDLADYVRLFGSSLGLSHQDIKAASDVAEAVVPRAESCLNFKVHHWDAWSSTSFAAAVIYLVGNLPQSSKKLSTWEISSVTDVAESTIEARYSVLHRHAPTLVPKYFAGEADLRQLPPPYCVLCYDTRSQAALRGMQCLHLMHVVKK